MAQHDRRHATVEELAELAALLDVVPAYGYDWGCPRGLDFLAKAKLVVAQDVPVPWLAPPLDLTSAQLGTALYRYRLELRGRLGLGVQGRTA